MTLLICYIAIGFTSLFFALFVDFQENLNVFLKEAFSTAGIIVALWPLFWAIGIFMMIKEKRHCRFVERSFKTKLVKHR